MLQVLECLASFLPAWQLLPTEKAQEQQPDLAELPVRLCKYMQGAVAGSSRQAAQLSLPAKVSLVKGAVICGRYDWSPEHAILEPVRATASFYGAEYFDSVAVASGMEGQLWYAQLRALFWMWSQQTVSSMNWHRSDVMKRSTPRPAAQACRITWR